MCGAVNMLPGTAGDPEGEGVHMCGAVNMLPGTASVSWCSVTLKGGGGGGGGFTCVELPTCYQVLLVLVGVQ